MAKDRTPLDVAEHVETDKSLNQVENSGFSQKKVENSGLGVQLLWMQTWSC
jgi:hypothetical protein